MLSHGCRPASDLAAASIDRRGTFKERMAMKNSKIRMPENCWVAVCDGKQALLLRNRGDARHPDLVVIWSLSNPGELTHELGNDRPGRVMPRYGTARSAVEQPDLHQKAETELLEAMMRQIDEAIHLKRASGVIFVAPTSVLGWIRKHMPKAVEQAVVGELGKDLTHFSVNDIQQYLLAARHD